MFMCFIGFAALVLASGKIIKFGDHQLFTGCTLASVSESHGFGTASHSGELFIVDICWRMMRGAVWDTELDTATNPHC